MLMTYKECIHGNGNLTQTTMDQKSMILSDFSSVQFGAFHCEAGEPSDTFSFKGRFIHDTKLQVNSRFSVLEKIETRPSSS